MTDSRNGRTDGLENEGYDEWLDALASGSGFYLGCPDGHGSLPPRRVCPDCGSADLEQTALPETGTVATYTVVHVAPPSFVDDAPYVTAVVDFGAVQLTGILVDIDHDEVDTGITVSATVRERETDGERVVAFRPE